MTEHPSLEVLADAAEGLLEPGAAAQVEQHVAGCAACQAEMAALDEVSGVLAATSAPVMPAGIADRLAAVLADEQDRRVRHGALHAVPQPQAPLPTQGSPLPRVPRHPYGTPAQPRPGLGRFGADLHRVSPGRRWVLPTIAAAVAAAVVGFGGYVLSAALGLNEPPLVSVSVSQGQLGPQARDLMSAQDVRPHRFSQAWFCAREAQKNPIVGIASTTAGGEPALLVYVQTKAGLGVTVVTGCGTGDPSALPWVAVPR